MITPDAPVSTLRHWGAVSKRYDGKFYLSYGAKLHKAIGVLWIFISLLYVTEYTHLRVFCQAILLIT